MDDENSKIEKDEVGTLERLRRRLYGSKEVFEEITPRLRSRTAPIPTHWGQMIQKHTPTWFRIPSSQQFLIGSVAFFVIAIIASSMFLLFGNRLISTEQVDIRIEAPTTIAGGDTVTFIVTITNKNPTTLENARMTIDFPDGTFKSDATTPFSRYIEELGDIESGGKVERTIEAVMYGDEATVVTLPVNLQYESEGSTSIFVKKKEHAITIGSSPVNVTVQNVPEIASGQEMAIVVSVRSNAPSDLAGVALEAEYPFGFIPTRTTPTSDAKDFFLLGDLKKGEEKTITIFGTMSGQDSDERVFRFIAGTIEENRPNVLGLTFISKESKIRIIQPFLSVDLLINRGTGDTIVVSPFENVLGFLSWENTLKTTIVDAELAVTLRGAAINPSTISSRDGFFDSNRNTIFFTRERLPSLARILPGEKGNGTFEYSLVPLDALGTMNNPQMTLIINIKGRTDEAGETEVTSTLTRTVKVATDLGLNVRAVRTIGNIENSGPMPPEVGKETTYTILMNASNVINSVADARVFMSLPSYVTFTGITYPNNGSITYNETTREVSWLIGEMESNGAPKEAQFQVSLTPSISQEGSSPDLAISPRIIGFDRFVQQEVASNADDVSTYIWTDPDFENLQGDVK
jgi:hypothetical protein